MSLGGELAHAGPLDLHLVLRVAEADAGRLDVDEGESGIADSLLDHGGESIHVARDALGDEPRAIGERVEQGIHRALHAAVHGRARPGAAGRRGRDLALRQAIHLVVHHDVGQVGIAADGMRHVAAADRETIAIAPGREHEQIGVCQFDALGDGQRAAVHGVEPVGRGIAGDPARAADAGDERDLMRRPADRREGAVEGVEHAVVAAARTPDGLQGTPKILGSGGGARGRGSAGGVVRGDHMGLRRSAPTGRDLRVPERESVRICVTMSSGVMGLAPLRA